MRHLKPNRSSWPQCLSAASKLARRWGPSRLGVRLGAAIAGGWIYCAVFSHLPLLQTGELELQDNLMRLHPPGLPPPPLVLLQVNPAALPGSNLHNLNYLHRFYAALVKSLMTNGARVVVLNLPEPLKQYGDNDSEAQAKPLLKALINQYSDQIVLVARPIVIASGSRTLNTYNQLLPFDDKTTSPAIVPEQIIGYFRHAPNAHGLNNPARRVEIGGRFSYEDDPTLEKHHRVKSVAALALEKFYKTANDAAGLQSLVGLHHAGPLQVNFWGPADTFPSLNFQLHCTALRESEPCRVDFDAPSQLRDKLVLIDLPQGQSIEYGEYTPYGEMAIAEVQANQIATLMTHSFLTPVSEAAKGMITILGIVGLSLYPARQDNLPKTLVQRIYVFLGLLGGYSGLSLALFWQGWLLPLALPLLGWLGTGTGMMTYALCHQSAQQRQKLAERQAVLLQTRKLLYRVAADIHDGPLQDLKLAMDSIELLAIDHSSPLIDPLLDRLEAIGLGLRNQLSNTRTIAEKLEITPELQFGLASGIQQWVQRLTNTGELQLIVQQDLQPLREPKSDSGWIDAREDVFRFLREAIANVICHAQPPHGTATQVLICLWQKGNQCWLVIENNGVPLKPLVLPAQNHRSTGYGTKIMTTIAAELPNGTWERLPLAAGGMRVTLSWTIAAA